MKLANKKFTQVKNDFCLIFEKYSKITEVADTMTIATQSFEFTDIKSIQDVPAWRQVDICGVVAEVGPVENKNLKSG